jgi:hypothetical protein
MGGQLVYEEFSKPVDEFVAVPEVAELVAVAVHVPPFSNTPVT